MKKQHPTSLRGNDLDLLDIIKFVHPLVASQKKDILSFIATIKKEKPSGQDTNVQ
jgi:hypothetical protein